MIKAVVFDLDGTLLDRDSSLALFLRAQYQAIPPMQKITYSLYRERFVELDRRGYVWKDRVYQQLIEQYDLELTVDYLLKDYLDRFPYYCVGFDGMHDILRDIKNKHLKLGIITNGYSQFQRANIHGLGITDYFDTIVVSEEEKLKKPDIAIFTRALERLEVHESEAIYIGDHPVNDVEASIQAGMIGVWKEDRYYSKPQVNCHIIQQLPELIPLLNDAIS